MMKKNGKLQLKKGIRLIGLVLLAFVLWNVDWQNLLVALKKISLPYLLLVIPMYLSIYVVKTFRWYYILRIQGIRISLLRILQLNIAAIFWGAITPGKVGEFVKIYYLHAENVPTGKGTLSVFIDRGSDIFILLLLIVAGILELSGQLTWLSILIVTVSGLILIAVFLKYIHLFVEKIKPLIFMIARKLKKDPGEFLEDFKKDMSLFNWSRVTVTVIFTAIAGAVYTLPLYLLGTMLHLEVPPMILALSILLSSAVSTLPVSISGLGTRDSFLILYLGRFGVTKESAIIFSFLFIYMNVVSVIFSWLVYMTSKRNKKGSTGEAFNVQD